MMDQNPVIDGSSHAFADEHAHSDKNGAGGYGAVSRIFHWSTALLIAIMVPLGLYAARLPPGTEPRIFLLMVHKSIGLFIIALTLMRFAWRIYSGARLDETGLKRWEVLTARLGHFLLYAILLLMPLSGVMMSQGGGKEVGFFNLFFLPQIFPFEKNLPLQSQYYFVLGRYLHEVLFQLALYIIFALHMAGVLKHQILDGDKRFIRRMWGFR